MNAVLDLSGQTAEAVRTLNHTTRGGDALADPPECCWLLANLSATAQRRPQLLGQVSRWLSDQHAKSRLRADNDVPAGLLTAATATALDDAARHAHQLAAAIDTAHQHAAHLATA